MGGWSPFRIKRPSARSRGTGWRPALVVLLLASAACQESVPETEVLVVIDTNLEVGSQLTSIQVRVFDRDGSEELRSREFALSGKNGAPAQHVLPISLSLVAESQGSTRDFRVVVTGRGPLGDGGDNIDVIEQQAIVAFRPNTRRRLDIFLGATCFQQLCRDAGEQPTGSTCNLLSSECEAVPERSDLPAAIGDGVAQFTPPSGVQRDASTSGMDTGMRGTDAETPTEAGAEPPDVAEACRGNAGAAVCADATLIHCDDAGTATSEQSCASARHCQEGLDAGTCPPCLDGEYRCDGAELQRCDQTSQWVTAQVCPSEALCSATARDCTDVFCTSETFNCAGDTLQRCNPEQTAFVDDQACMSGLCDAVAGECDVCLPNARSCEDAQSVRTCDAQGQTSSVEDCPAARSRCTGDGVCVQCTEDSHCPAPTNECVQEAVCNTASGTCESTPKAAQTPCSSGVCDGDGTCVECVESSDCNDPTPFCVDDACRPCEGGSCAVGTTCERNSDCASGICDSVCRPVCSGDCESGDECAVEEDCRSDHRCTPRTGGGALCDAICDVFAQDCETGACYFTWSSRDGTCGVPDEAGTQGVRCTAINSCAEGYNCMPHPVWRDDVRENMCQFLCDASGGGGPNCTDGPGASFTCLSLEQLGFSGEQEIGLCVDCDHWSELDACST